jgi:hypothetical protein
MNKQILYGLAALILAGLACSMLPGGQATVPTPTAVIPSQVPPSATTPPTAVLPTQTSQPQPTAAPATAVPPTNVPATAAPALQGPYAVIFHSPDKSLPVYQAPNEKSAVVANLPWDENNVMLTGKEDSTGQYPIVEVDLGSGNTGWVNRLYLTESMPAAQFCADARVTDLLDRLADAVNSEDGDKLKALVSPLRGMEVTFYRTGNTIPYNPEQVGWLYNSTYQTNWGTQPASGMEVTGSFREVVSPMLKDVFGKPNQRTCNAPQHGGSTYTYNWPYGYRNLNYYSVYKPGTPGTDLDWRTWLVGVEYYQGKPYVAALVQLFWEP